jgi:N-acyl-D-aspartate/D-glutamate deacylase
MLRPGYFADVVVFNPKTIRALSTYREPKLLATGVTYLLVNGQFAIDAGKLTNAHAGRALPHGYPYPMARFVKENSVARFVKEDSGTVVRP